MIVKWQRWTQEPRFQTKLTCTYSWNCGLTWRRCSPSSSQRRRPALPQRRIADLIPVRHHLATYRRVNRDDSNTAAGMRRTTKNTEETANPSNVVQSCKLALLRTTEQWYSFGRYTDSRCNTTTWLTKFQQARNVPNIWGKSFRRYFGPEGGTPGYVFLNVLKKHAWP